jgi:hypothetical protein
MENSINNNLKKNWRLVQLMTALEDHQGSNPLGPKDPLGKFVTNTYPNVRNKVTYKNVYITNPLIQNVKILKTINPSNFYEILNLSEVNKSESSLEQNLDINNKSACEKTLSKVTCTTMFERFSIKANFVAQWLSENIVSSKTYKLSLLCDRVIKTANINSTKIIKDREKTVLITLVGIKIVISGRILGAEIATSKTFKAGQIPNNTITVLKDRGFALAKTRSGTIGIKVTYFWKINEHVPKGGFAFS